MRTGCLYAFVVVIGTLVISVILLLAVQAILPAPVTLNPEGIGRIVGFVLWLFVAPAAFIFGYRRQAKREANKPRPPENLHPIDYSQLGETLHGTPPLQEEKRDV
jgi:hypothetical protein